MNLPATLGGYSTRDVATMLGLSQAQVRSFVRSGFLVPPRGPRGELRFSFQDLVLLRAARGLVEARVPARRVCRALSRLRDQLPTGRPLSAVRVLAEGNRVVAREGGEVWYPESGQALLDFEVSELARDAAPFARRAAAEARARDERHEEAEELRAEDWYGFGYGLEATAPDDAIFAYGRALALDPDHPDANLNLGRLLHEADDLAGAEAHYRRALAARPDDATAAFNLGVALEDQGRLDEAAAAYERAVAADPDLADAHYNLAGVAERLERHMTALRHLRLYKNLIG